jgi:hypothetical protein
MLHLTQMSNRVVGTSPTVLLISSYELLEVTTSSSHALFHSNFNGIADINQLSWSAPNVCHYLPLPQYKYFLWCNPIKRKSNGLRLGEHEGQKIELPQSIHLDNGLQPITCLGRGTVMVKLHAHVNTKGYSLQKYSKGSFNKISILHTTDMICHHV